MTLRRMATLLNSALLTALSSFAFGAPPALTLATFRSPGFKPFTVDIMVKSEGVAEALFSPQGDRLLLEQVAAYDTSENFGWERAWSHDRGVLMKVDLRGGAQAPQALLTQDGQRTWLGSYSPSGARAAIGWFDGDVAKLSVYDFRTGELKSFGYRVSNGGPCAFDCPYWLSEEEFIHYTVSADEQMRQLSRNVYTEEMTRRWAQQSWRGQESGVKVLGSGRYQVQPREEGATLLRVNATTGAARALATGVFYEMGLSPDRRRLATVTLTGIRPVKAETTVKSDLNNGKLMTLTVYDLARGSAQVLPCGACNVTAGSLRWSPSGQKLFFSARTQAGGSEKHQFYIYDFSKGRLESFAPQGVAFGRVESVGEADVTPFLWLTDDAPAVRITKVAASNQEKDQHAWYALPRGRAPVLLTAGLKPVKDKRPLRDYVAVHQGRLLLMADGELWQVSADGTRQNLTQGIAEPVSPWCSVISYWREAGWRPVCSGFRVESAVRPIDKEALEKGWVTLRVIKDDVFTGDLIFLNVQTGQTRRITRPDSKAELVTASAMAHSALYRRKGRDGDRLLLAFSQGKVRELLHFNQHLAGVVGGTPLMLTRREAGDTEDRYDWLLLPPGHQSGQRHPLLVYFYPGNKYSKEMDFDDLRDVNFLNQHLPAARGFVVLLASMQISALGTSGNPMTQMHEQLIRAAENVVSHGYADSERWALMGHSYGGYGTSSVITQTERFKAAIAISGVSNLISAYAMGLSAEKATAVAASQSVGMMWMENGQGRMGVPPWENPQRYLDNSPVLHAHKITTPLMLVHGDYDFVNINEAEQMFNALNRQGKDAQLLRYWGEGHSILSPANMRDLWHRIFTFLDEQLNLARDARGPVRLEADPVKARQASH